MAQNVPEWPPMAPNSPHFCCLFRVKTTLHNLGSCRPFLGWKMGHILLNNGSQWIAAHFCELLFFPSMNWFKVTHSRNPHDNTVLTVYNTSMDIKKFTIELPGWCALCPGVQSNWSGQPLHHDKVTTASVTGSRRPAPHFLVREFVFTGICGNFFPRIQSNYIHWLM